MKIKPFFILLLCLPFARASGQASILLDTLKERYDHEMLHFIGGAVTKGGEYERLTRQQLKEEFDKSPLAYDAFYIYTRKRTKAYVIMATSFALVLSSPIFHNSNRDLSLGLFIAGTVGYSFAIPLFSQAHKNLYHAVWVRNRDILLH